jgi:regulator of protease activity HflC (stomatin/prohibitin superfamily)
MNESAFACVPRHLVEDFAELLEKDTQYFSMSEAFEHTDSVNAAARAALDAMLAKAREDALREAAEMVNRNLGKPAHHAHAAILSLIHTAEGEDT